MEWISPKWSWKRFGHPGASNTLQKSGSRDFLSESSAHSDDAAHLVLTRRKEYFFNDEPISLCCRAFDGGTLSKSWRVGRTGRERDRRTFLARCARPKIFYEKVVKAQGFNIGMNLGECAGAGCPIISTSTLSHAGVAILFYASAFGDARDFGKLASLYEKLMAARSTDWSEEQ